MEEQFRYHMLQPSVIEQERIKGIAYSGDPSRCMPMGDDVIAFRGEHETHTVWREENWRWSCTCSTFAELQPVAECRHVIAVERIQSGAFNDPLVA